MPSFGQAMLGAQHMPPTQTPAPADPDGQEVLQVTELPEQALTGPVPVQTPAAHAIGFAQQSVPSTAGGFGLSRLKAPQPHTFVPRPHPRSKAGWYFESLGQAFSVQQVPLKGVVPPGQQLIVPPVQGSAMVTSLAARPS